MNSLKSIAVFTSIRSEYEPLKYVLKKIINDNDLRLDLLVGGAHLKEEYGLTKNQIIGDGFDISAEFDFLISEKKSDYITQSMGLLQTQIGNWLKTNKPDLLLVLGDRFELLPVVSSALLYNIPIAHISGGDVTEGAIDNQIRHAITKMAHIHFPAMEIYKQNILKLGEEEWRICVCGEPGLDEIINMDFYPKEKLFSELGLSMYKETISLTFHPETINNSITPNFVAELITKLLNETNYQILATASNFDMGGEQINQVLEKFNTTENFKYVKNLGKFRYYSLLKYSNLVLGNSSSGIFEAQSFNLPAINVGNRQLGRLFNKSVYHVKSEANEILRAIKYVTSPDFIKTFCNEPNIYGDGNSCGKIIDFIKKVNPDKLLFKKSTF